MANALSSTRVENKINNQPQRARERNREGQRKVGKFTPVWQHENTNTHPRKWGQHAPDYIALQLCVCAIYAQQAHQRQVCFMPN